MILRNLGLAVIWDFGALVEFAAHFVMYGLLVKSWFPVRGFVARVVSGIVHESESVYWVHNFVIKFWAKDNVQT